MVGRRLAVLAGIVLVWGAAIFCKLVALQVVHHGEYVKKARARQEQVIPLRAQRGAIFDRTGHPLAMSVPDESIFVDPLKLPSLEVDSDLLARELHLDPAETYRRIKSAYDTGRGFLWVKKGIDPEEADAIRDLKLDWIHIDTASERHYPNGMLASHVLGGVDFSEHGNGGVEQALDSELRGAPGEARLLTDVKRRGIDELVATEARAGETLTLTIDERLQFVAEREIAAAVQKHGAVSGSVVAMNPYNGEILALASYPTYDPNQPPVTEEEKTARSNHAVSVPFEPGSVFKVITLSAALETTKLRPDTPINCHGGVLTLFGRTIHDSHGGNGWLPMDMVLAHSSNIGAIEIGLQVGRDNMYDYVNRFGFHQRTGLPLPGESRGRLSPLSRWQATSLASIAFGHEIAVTTMQLARAAAVVANGGLLIKPRLILKEGDRVTPVEQPVRAIRPETAITMRQMMEGVVLKGTGKEARLQGYTSGGKTGSAQIIDATHHYTHNRYNGTFMGFAPVTNPAIVVVVTLNGTHGTEGFGGASAAPVFKVVTTEALRILDVPKDLPEDNPAHTLIADNRGLDDSSASLDGTDPLNEPDEDEAVATLPQGPVAPNPRMAKVPVMGTVPNFKGMTLRAVLMEAQDKGIPVQPDGSGVARVQNPPPGAPLHQGERIRVQFAR